MINTGNSFRLLFIILLLPTFLIGQISIDYQNPEGSSVCDTATYEVTISNNAPDSIKGVSVTIDLPIGIDYINNTISGATEQDISNPNAPIFGLVDLASGDSQTFTFDGFYQCDLIDRINSGQLFTNDITVNHQDGSQSITTTPYLIETALLIITGIDHDNLIGTKGDVLTRTLTIQNTRIGALSSFNFRDQHEGGIEISTNLGTLVSQDATSFEVQLGPADFMNIGDGDGLFELDEVITLTQTILITDCGFTQNDSNSDLILSWGCGGQVCQQTFSFALVQFLPSTDNPVVTGFTSSGLSTNFCAELPAQQGLTLYNIGSAPTEDIEVTIFMDAQQDFTGMDPNSFQLDSSGQVSPIEPMLEEGYEFDGCSFDGSIYRRAILMVPLLGPGESLTIRWDNYSCAPSCGSPINTWNYLIEYEIDCPEGETVFNSGDNANNIPIGELMTDTVTFSIGEVILDNTTHSLDYGLRSDLLVDSVGVLNLEFVLPCGFKWESDNNLTLGGNLPIDFDIQTTPFNSIVSIDYELPMNSDTVFTSFDLSFSCDAPCLPPGQYIEQYNTSCPLTDLCVSDTIYMDTMSVNSAIILDSISTSFCAIQECQLFPLQYVCYNGLTTQIYPPGFLNYELESLRENYGLVDNNDDRKVDLSGVVNEQLIRRDRLLPGDTLRTLIDGAILMDLPDSSFAFGAITLNFESHSIDDNINNGFWLSEQDRILMEQGGIESIDAELKIYDSSTGSRYNCPIDPATILYGQRARVASPNTRPEDILDDVIFTTYIYNINIQDLQSCLPANYLYEAADSIQFIARHKMVYNPTQDINSEGVPMIVNMRTSSSVTLTNPEEATFNCICPSVDWQYSPYRYRVDSGNYDILPCDAFDEPGDQGFRIFLGEGNFFPFEVRPLAYIDEWLMTPPLQVNLLSTTLTSWEIQGGNTLASNVSLNPDGDYGDDFELYQTPLIDEGFSFSLEHKFSSDCFQRFPLPMVNRLTIDFADNLPEIVDPLDTIIITDNAFIARRPFLSLASAQANFVSFDNLAFWDFLIANNQTALQDVAENVWITLNSFSGLLDNFRLINTATGEEIIPINGVYQLGDMAINQVNNYRLYTRTNSCEIERLRVNYGWNCEPLPSPNTTPCDQKSFEFSVISPRGEIELDIISPITPVELCDTIPYHTIEIFNAQIGAVFRVKLDAELPQGLLIVPGSCQLAFPTNGTFIDIPDPIDLGGGIVQWDISALSDSIALRGLAGVGSSPNNSVSIRFLSATECGFISGSQVVFTASAYQNCEEATNTISRAGDQLLINGVAVPYESQFTITTNDPTSISCNDDFTMSVTMQADGVTLSRDSIQVMLPPGVYFDEDSYSPLSNANLDGPNITFDSTSQILSWGILEDIPANTPISFEITLLGFSEVDCGTNMVQVQSIQTQTAVCSLTGESCSVSAQTGFSTLDISIDHPVVDISRFGGAYENGQFNFDLGVNNSSASNGEDLTIDFYLDLDGDGMLSPGDSLVSTEIYTGPVLGNGVTDINGSFALGMESLCSLLAVIEEDDNCACNSDASTLLNPLSNTLPELTICSNIAETIGIDGTVGNTYQWIPAGGLDCATCPNTTITLQNNTSEPVTSDYTLVEDLGNCTLSHQVRVTINDEPGIIDDMPSVCSNESITLTADPGSSYNWEGDGISNPNMQTQTVNPSETSTYSLTITDNNGCIGIDEIDVQVFPAPTVSAGEDEEYCEEDLVVLNATSNPNYTYEWSPSDQLASANTSNPIIILNEDTTYGLTITDENNCTATDEVAIAFDEGPELELSIVEETICNGSSIILEVSGGQDYSWFPAGELICTDGCATVEASPAQTTVYTVLGYNENGCESSANITVNVSLDTLMGEETVYLCEGDTLFIDGLTIFETTTICNDLSTAEGCDSIHCVNYVEADLPEFAFPDDITVEAEQELTIALNPNYSYQWQPSGIIPDCTNCSEVTFSLDATQEFTVIITSNEGCVIDRTVRVRVFPVCSAENVKPPNSFTPNGDGYSDKFTYFIPEDHLEEVKSMKIFNRWGHVVFEGAGNDACWDGTYDGKPAPQDVYIYIIEVGCSNRNNEVLKGDLTLMR